MKDRIKSRSPLKKNAAEKTKNGDKKRNLGEKAALAKASGGDKKVSSKNGQKSVERKDLRGATVAKNAVLAQLDDLLSKPGAIAAGTQIPAESAQPRNTKRKVDQLSAEEQHPKVGNFAEIQQSRFERCLIRAQKGEPGPIKLADLYLDPEIAATTKKSGAVETYKKILEATPNAQPGRPLVNIRGNSDTDLRFDLLTLYELVMAAIDLGREHLQVSLVRLSEAEAKALHSLPPVHEPVPEVRSLSPLDVAKMNGFMEVNLEQISRDENLRQSLNDESPEFRNLIESIRTIGLQNPPVLEVRNDSESKFKLVCISGHRRLLALEKLGVTKVTCALKVFESEKHRALAGLAENINREDLHFLDKADGYGLLAHQGMNASEIAALLDADTRTVGKYLRASAWDSSVKVRIRSIGSKATTRFLLNALAAGERTTAELHAMIDRFLKSIDSPSTKPKPPSGLELKRKLGEFCTLAGYGNDERAMIEKALRFLGFMS